MEFICLVCDVAFSMYDHKKVMVSYVMCPDCFESNRKKAIEEIRLLKPKKSTRQKKTDTQYRILQSALRKKGITIEIKHLKKMFTKIDKNKLIRQLLKSREK